MTLEALRRAYHASPFQPFAIYMADGRSYEVPHAEFISISPSGRTVAVHHDDGSVSVLDLLQVKEIEIHGPKVDNTRGSQNGEKKTIEQLRRVHQATPFQPFSLYMADGRSYDVPHRDFLSHSPTGRTVVVYHEDDSASIIDLLLINEIKTHSPKNAPQNGDG